RMKLFKNRCIRRFEQVIGMRWRGFCAVGRMPVGRFGFLQDNSPRKVPCLSRTAATRGGRHTECACYFGQTTHGVCLLLWRAIKVTPTATCEPTPRVHPDGRILDKCLHKRSKLVE